MAKNTVETPLMKQHAEMKKRHPDAILLFRVGDFYETFSDDAVAASEILGITLTKRSNGSASAVALAGFPHHALDTYLPRLIRAGKRVAICDQLEDPKKAKGLVKRGITELVTPGVSLGDNLLDHGSNNFLASVRPGSVDGDDWGVAFLDISTGEFMCAQGHAGTIDKLLGNFMPKEVLVEHGTPRRRLEEALTGKFLLQNADDWTFVESTARERLLKQFGTSSLKGYGIDGMTAAICAAGAALHYLDQTNHTRTGHICSIKAVDEERYVRLDRYTVRNLELVEPLTPEGRTLFNVINRTLTPMGTRLLRRRMLFPLKNAEAINRRLDMLEHFMRHPEQRNPLREVLEQTGDLERAVSKVATGRINPRELSQLRRSLLTVKTAAAIAASGSADPTLASISRNLDHVPDLCERIAATLADEAPLQPGKGNTIRQGVSEELDQLRDIAFKGKDYLGEIRDRESAATGIPSLKIGYNNVFGYYIEVTNTHRDKVPAEWTRKQTLVNAERYITPELKHYEMQILGAEDRIDSLERSIFADLVEYASGYVQQMHQSAGLMAELDVVTALTVTAIENRYVRPIVDNSLRLRLTEARHPVIEQELPPGEPYISNSVDLDNDGIQIMMITGPNMSGKSALLRQTALNVLLAQIGSFVAADSAHIGVVDKIFTRVGASDNISLGESTFMVEMNEAASIVNNLSRRSLVLFDELGRGTSTYDGISLAWSIVEYIHEYGDLRPKTLFATHYHELNEMAASYDRIANYNVSVSESDGKVVFLRKLRPGGSEHSFGLHVARLAGMPAAITDRAEQVLKRLEDGERNGSEDKTATIQAGQNVPKTANGSGQSRRRKLKTVAASADEPYQMTFFQLDDPVLTQIRDALLNLDIDNLTPLAALTKLNDIRSILTGQ